MDQRDSDTINDYENVTGEVISDYDVGIELEPPEEGSTVQNPPNGGIRAWLIVLSCAGINCLLGALMALVTSCLNDVTMSTDTEISQQKLQEISSKCFTLVQIYAAPTAVVMIYIGYRLTVCIGATVAIIPLAVISHLNDDENWIKFLLYGPFAMGLSFIQLGILVPILEYFTTKRMAALLLSRVGTFIGSIIPSIILTVTKATIKWREFLRGSTGLCVGIGLIGLTLKDLKLTMSDEESATFVQRAVGLWKRDILKNVLFWLTCIVYFFYQFGIEIPKAELPKSAGKLDLTGSIAKYLVYILSGTIGVLVGIFLSWLFKKITLAEKSCFYVKKIEGKALGIIFVSLATTTLLSGIGSFVAPSALNFGYFTAFSLLFSTFSGFCEGIRDSSVPEVFGRENIKMVEGFIFTASGLGGIITNEIAGETCDDDWRKLFRYGGGMLFLSSAVTIAVMVADKKKAVDVLHAKIHGNTDVPLRPYNYRRNDEEEDNDLNSSTPRAVLRDTSSGEAGARSDYKYNTAYGSSSSAKAGARYGARSGAKADTRYDASSGANAGARYGARSGAKADTRYDASSGANAGARYGEKSGAKAGARYGASSDVKPGARSGVHNAGDAY